MPNGLCLLIAAHVEEVLEHTFEYIQLLKSPSGISEWIFNEVILLVALHLPR